ncbi:hypothetical protein D3C72_2445070 [compost metagenome]
MDGFIGTANAGAGTITYVPTSFTGTECEVVYTEAAAAVGGATPTPARTHGVAVDTDGCDG